MNTKILAHDEYSERMKDDIVQQTRRITR